MEYALKEFKNVLGEEFEALFFGDDPMPQFLIEWEKIEGLHADFIVHEINSWTTDNIPSDYEKYLNGTIKWDGCSHIWFGGEDRDGYLHLCGKHYFDKHCKLLQAMWDICSKRIEDFDSEIAG